MNMQAISGVITAVALGVAGWPAAAGRWPDQGFLVCAIGGKMSPIAWVPGASGEIAMLSGTRPEGAMIEAGNALLFVGDNSTTILRMDGVTLIQGDHVRTGPCVDITEQVAAMTALTK